MQQVTLCACKEQGGPAPLPPPSWGLLIIVEEEMMVQDPRVHHTRPHQRRQLRASEHICKARHWLASTCVLHQQACARRTTFNAH